MAAAGAVSVFGIKSIGVAHIFSELGAGCSDRGAERPRGAIPSGP